jgi:WD40 repeat protein
VRLWDLTSGRLDRVLEGHRPSTRAVAFSPDGRLLATIGSDGMVRLWGATTGAELRCLDGRAECLRGVAFSPDGRTLAATASDNDVRLWGLHQILPTQPEP